VATNAAGAATFKYGTTRDWVSGLTLACRAATSSTFERGATHASPEGHFDVLLGDRTMQVRCLPIDAEVRRSRPLFRAPHMDLIDLFIGAEGHAGVITR